MLMDDLLSPVALAVLVAVTSWWLGTGVILWLVRLPPRLFRTSMSGVTVLLLLSLAGTAWSMRQVSVAADYVGFISVILMWSWHEMAFLSGWVTGPRRVPQDPAASGWRRFALAVQALLYHELALLLNFLVLCLMQSGQPNHVALCTFALLWCMRLSAKLNLYFGVPQVGEQYLPGHLAYMASYFRKSSVTGCFYLTMTLSTGTWLWLVLQAHRGAVEVSTGWVLLASLLGLAIIEHVLMMFALPLQRLWGWAMRHRAVTPVVPASGLPTQADRI
jgi:putative photosynthetic complex assembly protein 2